MHHISMRLDHGAACLEPPSKATQQDRVGWLINMSTMTKGAKIAVPLLAYERHEQRGGRLCNGVLVTEDRENGTLSFGVVSDIGADCEASRAAYQPEREITALDFGLSTLFAGHEGQLRGKGWLKALRAYDQRITRIACGQQRHTVAGRVPARDTGKPLHLFVAGSEPKSDVS